MTVAQAQSIPGSYRDPAGGVHRLGDRILRTVSPEHEADFTAALRTGILDRMADAGRIVAFDSLSLPPEALGLAGAARVLEHPRLPFISHPYEWSFQALRAAALHHLDVHLEAMEGGLTLSDASAYNVQLLGARPVFIDILSFRPYREGEIWAGYRQFCEQFLNPLLLCAHTGLMPNAWYRGALEGIPTSALRSLLPWRAKLSRRVLLHVVAHSALERAEPTSGQTAGLAKSAALPRAAFLNMLRDLRAWVAKLTPKGGRSLWSDYTSTCSYLDEEQSAKRDEVAAFASAVRPKMLWDMGCNTAEYSLLALRSGADRAIGWDGDARAVDAAFVAARDAGAELTPLVGDLANPSPNQGWAESERAGLNERSAADAAMALALIHHLVFGANVPLRQAVGWFVGLAPRGLIEFVPPEDVQVRTMIARRTTHHPYDREHFVAALDAAARVEKSRVIGPSGRELFWYDRTA
ncbi:MAG: class I SAM-dependent methyltransferase [Propylenella sp.]